MAYELFMNRFDKLARKETRSATVFANNSYGLPADEYGLIEAYCDDENCDCRRVFFNIASRKREEIIAVVTYGWESESFYRKWFGSSDTASARMAVKEMTGLGLNSASHQSEIAPAALELVRDILQDKNYVARIKRHYKIFKETVDGQPVSQEKPLVVEIPHIPIDDGSTRFLVQKTRKRHHSR